MRVIDVLGMEIEGLFAAGEVMGGFHGHGEIPGAALGKAFIFGRFAAKSAVALSPHVPMTWLRRRPFVAEAWPAVHSAPASSIRNPITLATR